MQRRKKNLVYLVPGIISLIFLIICIFLVDPEKPFVLSNEPISPLFLLLLFVFVTTFSFSTVIFSSRRRGLLAGIFFVSILALRSSGIKIWYYPILVFGILVLVDMFWSN